PVQTAPGVRVAHAPHELHMDLLCPILIAAPTDENRLATHALPCRRGPPITGVERDLQISSAQLDASRLARDVDLDRLDLPAGALEPDLQEAHPRRDPGSIDGRAKPCHGHLASPHDLDAPRRVLLKMCGK